MSHHPIASDTPASAGTDLEHSGPDAAAATDTAAASDPSVASDDSDSVTSEWMEEVESDEEEVKERLDHALFQRRQLRHDLRRAANDMMCAVVDSIMYMRWVGLLSTFSKDVHDVATKSIERFGFAMPAHPACKDMRSKEEWISVLNNIRTGEHLPDDLNRTDFVVSQSTDFLFLHHPMPPLVLTFHFALQFTDFKDLTHKAVACIAKVEQLVSKWHSLRRDAIAERTNMARRNFRRITSAIREGDIHTANAELVDLVIGVESMSSDEHVYGSHTRTDMNWYIGLAEEQLRTECDRQRSST